jgi:integrase
MAKLTAAAVRSLLHKPGKYSDGDGLVLHVKAPGRGYWTYRYERAGRERWMVFGNAADLTLAAARAAHAEARALLVRGLDPLDERDRAKLDLSRSFADVALACISARAPQWRNPRTAPLWRSAIRDHANPTLGRMPVAEIGREHVLKTLTPLWTAKPDVARRLRVMLETILDYATAMHWRDGPNPAVWRGGLKLVLAAKPNLRAKHHAALEWREAPALMALLAANQSMGAAALRFLMLTAARSGEVRGCHWSEIDLDQRLWMIPAERMKAGCEHRVPLSDAAMEVLTEVAPLRRGEMVFEGLKAGRPLTDVTLKNVLRRLGHGDVTVHGFRSTFRDWCADHGKPADLAEQCLAHAVGSAVERAYRRSDVIERRRALMAEWGAFLTRPPAEVVPLWQAG